MIEREEEKKEEEIYYIYGGIEGMKESRSQEQIVFSFDDFLSRMSTDEVLTEKGLTNFYRNRLHDAERSVRFFRRKCGRQSRIIRRLKRRVDILELDVEKLEWVNIE